MFQMFWKQLTEQENKARVRARSNIRELKEVKRVKFTGAN